jgi:hypothetical protein
MQHHCPKCASRPVLVPALKLPGQRCDRLQCPACEGRYRIKGTSVPSLPVMRTDGGRSEAGFAESSDCAVRAYACAKGIAYAEAHAAFKAAGRRDRCGTSITQARAVMGDPESSCIATRRLQRPTFAQWLRMHRSGVWVVFVTGHAFAVRQGVAMDTAAPKARARMTAAWRIA